MKQNQNVNKRMMNNSDIHDCHPRKGGDPDARIEAGMTTRKRRPWPEKRRKAQAEITKLIKPWKKASGPRTVEGKAASSRNAFKHGLRSETIITLKRLLALQKSLLALHKR